MGTKKSTKKFEKNHLRDTIDRRREFSKVKQRHQIRDKKKTKNAAKLEEAARQENEMKSTSDGPPDTSFSNMAVDDFFAGGFEIADVPATTKPSKKQKKDVGPKTGKRKRVEDKDDADMQDRSDDESSAAGSSEESGGSDSDNLEAHKDQLEALKEKDPEFYKYLKENDAELLEFGDHGDLAEVDELSEAEEEEAPSSKKPKKSKKRDEKSDLMPDKTLKLSMVKQWQKSMLTQHSLRATRQAVLAFRIAAYVDEEDNNEDRKYTISNPDVYHQVLITALEEVPKVLNHHLPIKETAGGKIRLLTTLSDAAALKLTISSIEPMLPYILPFRKLLKLSGTLEFEKQF
ncbi:nucleolar Complex 2 protein [Microsporum canis CBS 113480]|uniref:Nucleolar Complex 2 protein n=1 Tax=Arthroderma otae (strain ATCC MYA-4605 / CBS 113480) TaxID=554155 RepID=C5FBF5_ARTOC|nr:nucleolar Complex 2 protein [Microsporum canis CBS 113480]EEQ27139.1 nucleolar Complex 2 protein [Microsporum canis CBS 113480]